MLGQVNYDISGWNDKNNDSLNDDLKELMQKSTNIFFSKLFDKTIKVNEESAKDKTPIRRGVNSDTKRSSRNLREQSVGLQFRNQLNELMTTINSTQPHYIRCIKPNQLKQSDNFVQDEVLRQLKYAGINVLHFYRLCNSVSQMI